MENYISKCECHIHSLNGGLAEAIILKRIGDNLYLAEYNGVKCTAFYHPLLARYCVDDVNGVIRNGERSGK